MNCHITILFVFTASKGKHFFFFFFGGGGGGGHF